MTRRLRRYAVLVCVSVLAAVMFVHGQTSNAQGLRDQLRLRYDIVALQDGVALVPHQREGDIRLIEIRNGGVAINGNVVSAREAREQLGADADLVLRVTYLDAPAQRDLARLDSAAPSQANPGTTDTGEPSAAPVRTQTHRGDLVRFGGDVTVGRDELVEGNVVAIGGSADVDGEVTQQVTVIGGSLALGPEAVVRGDVAVIGGSLNRSPSARIDGKLDDVGVGAQFPFNRLDRRFRPDSTRGRTSSSGSGLLTFMRASLLILSALIVVALGGRFVEAIANRAATEPLRSGLAGLLVEILFVPLLVITVVVLAVSIIGIPLLLLIPFGVVLAVVLMIVGFTGVACQVGRYVSNRFGIKRRPYATVALGVAVIFAISLIARLFALGGGLVFGLIIAGPLAVVGYLVEYIAWTMGIGAVILTWLGSRRHGGAPPPAAVPSTGV
jgi:hypothetical protein